MSKPKHYSHEGEYPRRGKFGNKIPTLFMVDVHEKRKGQPIMSPVGVNSDVIVFDTQGNPLYRQAPSYIDRDKRGRIEVRGGQILESYR